ncbi:MAG: hypothetical protein ACYC1Q_14215 [Bacteroidia bacterium]
MNKAFILSIVLALILLAACKATYLRDEVQISEVVTEVVYYRGTKSVTITDDSTKKIILSILSKAKRVPAKFIVLEKFEIHSQGSELIEIGRNDRCFNFRGATYRIGRNQSDKLNWILTRLILAKAHATR